MIRELIDNNFLDWLEAAGLCTSWRMWLDWFDFWMNSKLSGSRTPQDDTISFFSDYYAVHGGGRIDYPIFKYAMRRLKQPLYIR